MDCDEETMAAVKASSQLFNEYTEQVNCRLDKMEGNLTNKADGSVVVDMQTDGYPFSPGGGAKRKTSLS